ncbi:MAG TPA: TOMM precursor leader peptide-binding protein [Ktedonobacteraceae bacterium]|nr:TOMM precursor leader peptide-binding protein [Ktedonobacteraceae bacterium]
MRPKLKSDTFFIPVDEGVYIRNNEKSFSLKGKTLATWLERLAPILDGQHDLQELYEVLPADKRPVINKLILTLVEQGCIKDVSGELPHTLSPAMIDVYGPAITFIDYHTDSGAYRFQCFLNKAVLAIGSGESLVALAHALLETGNRMISLLDTGEAETNYERLQELLHVLQTERDHELRLNIIKTRAWPNEEQLQQACSTSTMVLYCSIGDSLAHVDQLNTICQHAHVPFLPAIVLRNDLHIGPLCRPDHTGCWQCYWRRWRAAQGLPAYTADGRFLMDEEQKKSVPGKPGIGIATNILAQEFFKYSTNVQWDTLENNVYILNLEHFQNVKHTLFPHPLCTVCRSQISLADQQAEVQEIAQLTQAHIADGMMIEQWADANSGIFSCIDDMDYHQLPLIRSQITVPLASDGVNLPMLPTVQAAGLDYAEVRLSATRQAITCYLESLADERRAYWGTYQQFRTNALRPEYLFGWKGTQSVESPSLAWTWAFKLTGTLDSSQDFTPLLIPGAAVAPRSKWNQYGNTRLFRQEIPATGVGTTWHETLADVLHRLSALLEPRPMQATLPRPIAEAAYSADHLCAAYREMLTILHTQVLLVDCTGASGVPCIAGYLNGKYIGVSSHWNTLCAIREALRSAVLAVQIKRTPGPGGRVEEEQSTDHSYTDMALLAKMSPQISLSPSLAGETDYMKAAAALYACIKQQGWDIVVAPLVRDQTVQSVFPCALRVLAVQQERRGML